MLIMVQHEKKLLQMLHFLFENMNFHSVKSYNIYYISITVISI